jgi:hypothetical protein
MRKFFYALLVLITCTTIVYAEYFGDVVLTGTNGPWIDVRSYSSLNDAITAIGTDNVTLLIPNEQVTTASTINANTTLLFTKDGSIANSGQLTINSKNIRAPDQQIFTGAGDIDFADGSVLRSSWFSSLVSAINLTFDDKLTLVVSEPANITSDCTLGSDITLKWEAPENAITADAGQTLSCITQPIAGDYLIFTGSGDFEFNEGITLNLAWFSHLRSALTFIGTDRVNLLIPDTMPVDFSDTVPSNVILDFVHRHGQLSISAGVTLTISDISSIETTVGQEIFAGAGTVTLSGEELYDFLYDISSITPYYGDIIYYNGTNWVDIDSTDKFGSVICTSFATDITYIGSDNRTLYISDNQTISSDITVPSNVTLKFTSDGLLTITDGHTLTINGPINAPYTQIFSADYTSSNHVKIGTQVVERPVEWFGAVGNGVTNDYAAFRSALISCCIQNGGGKLTWDNNKVYILNAGADHAIHIDRETLPDGTDSSSWTDAQMPYFWLEGRGKMTFARFEKAYDPAMVGYLSITGTGDGIHISNSTLANRTGFTGKIKISNIGLYGNGTADEGIHINHVNHENVFEDIHIRYFAGNGFEYGTCMTFDNQHFRIKSSCNGGWGIVADGNALSFYDCLAEGNCTGGILIGNDAYKTPGIFTGNDHSQANDIRFFGGASEYNRAPQIRIDCTNPVASAHHHVMFYGFYVEGQIYDTGGTDYVYYSPNSTDPSFIELLNGGPGTDDWIFITFSGMGFRHPSTDETAYGEEYFILFNSHVKGGIIGPARIGCDYSFSDGTAYDIRGLSILGVTGASTATFEDEDLRQELALCALDDNQVTVGRALGVGKNPSGDTSLLLYDAPPKLTLNRLDLQSWSIYTRSSPYNLIFQNDTADTIPMSLSPSGDLSILDDLNVTDDADIGGDLDVTGTITAGVCCDFVFDDTYKLPTIDELEYSIKTTSKLPNLKTPNGINMIDLMTKTEEQALYIIQLNKRIVKLESALEHFIGTN